ncbi:MAG: hypothetical protein AB7S54_08005 [Bacteroidales bacterium]
MKKLINVLVLSCAVICTSYSCKKETNKDPCACGIENPQENIEWLKYILDRSFCTEVYLYTYNGQEYIGVYDCPGVADGGYVIYSCDGTKYCQFIGLNASCDCSEDFLTNAEKILIYKQEN